MILRFVLVIGLFSVSLVTAQLTVTPFQNNSNDLEDFILTELLGCEIEISNIQFIETTNQSVPLILLKIRKYVKTTLILTGG